MCKTADKPVGWLILIIVVIWVICAFICAGIAGSKHRSAFGWFFLGLIFGVFALLVIASVGDARPQTVIVQQNVAMVHAPAAPAPSVDTSRWSTSDRAALEAARREPTVRQIEAAPVPAQTRDEPRDPREFEPAVVALKLLALAGATGFDEGAMDAIVSYLEAESGGIEYSRREAQRVTAWVNGLPAGDEAIRAASKGLRNSVGLPDYFLDAMTMIAGTAPTDLQNRWIAAFRRLVEA